MLFRERTIMTKKSFLSFIEIILLFILLTLAFTPFFIFNPETKILNDAARQQLPGSFIRLPDGVTHYEIKGPENAPLIVLIHGMSEPYYVWDRNFNELVKNGFRVLRYDLYGRGFSDRPVVRYDVNLFVRQLTNLLKALHIQQSINIAGVSMGGPIAAQFTVNNPQMVKSLVLIDSGGLPKPTSWDRQMLKIPFIGDYFMLVGSNDLLKAGTNDFFEPQKFPHWQNAFSQQTEFRGFRRAILSTIRNFDFYDMEETFQQLGKLDKPILLFWGEHDKTIPFSTNQRFLDLLPHASFYVVPNSGHMSNYEGAEFVNAQWVYFLKMIHSQNKHMQLSFCRMNSPSPLR